MSTESSPGHRATTQILIGIITLLSLAIAIERYGGTLKSFRDDYWITDISGFADAPSANITIVRRLGSSVSEHRIDSRLLGLDSNKAHELDASIPLKCGAQWRRGPVSKLLGERNLYDQRFSCDDPRRDNFAETRRHSRVSYLADLVAFFFECGGDALHALGGIAVKERTVG